MSDDEQDHIDGRVVRDSPQHGGAREGAGRKSIFAAKAIDKPFSMALTLKGHQLLATWVRRTKLSRNGLLALLALQFGDTLAFSTQGVVYPGKTANVLSIRMPPRAAAKLTAAHVRTGKSYSDIGEALLVNCPRATFPSAQRRS